MSKNTTSFKQAGFTIVELMVATLVFTIILMVIAYGVIRFSNAYYKGINASNTQNTVRSTIDTISQAVQFGTAQVSTGTYSGGNGQFCAGGYVFAYTIGQKYTGATPVSGNWGLVMQPMATATCPSLPITYSASTTKELLGQNMRIANLVFGSGALTNMYNITLTVAYGDGDLLCIPGDALVGCGSTTSTDAQLAGKLLAVPTSNIQCKAQAGSQFCAVSTLSTMVQKRVN